MIRYDPHEWWTHFFDIRGSMVREILGRVAFCVAWSALVVWLDEGDHLPFDLPLTIHTLVGTALGLLLVFRTNSAYDRFWEGRKLWGGIVNETRNLARAAITLPTSHRDEVRQAVHWTIAFAHAAMHGLRGKKSVGGARKYLDPAEADRAEASDHVALHCATRISRFLRSAVRDRSLTSYDFVYVDQNVQLLVDYLGGCERIHRTPLPFAYLVHLRRALLLYCFALPLALVGEFGWLSVPATLVVSYVFLGIEEIGVEIEDPFGEDENDLDLEGIVATIERNLTALIDEKPGDRRDVHDAVAAP